MKHLTPLRFMVLLAALTFVGCGETASESSACEEARAHVQACFPSQDARTPDTCSESDADEILSQDCDTLAASARSAEMADGFCNPFFWWTCTGGSSSTREEPEGYTFQLGINVCESELCVEDLFGEIRWGAECGKIVLEDDRGDVVAVDYINEYLRPWGGEQNTGGGFNNLELEPGSYTARLLRRDGSVARGVDGDEAAIAIDLLSDGGVERSARDFRILKTEAEAVRACSGVQGTLSSTCGGEAMDDDDTEWGWFIEIEGINSEGTYRNMKRSRFVYSVQDHSYLFPRVRAGEYTVTFHELDVWSSWARRDNNNAKYEDYLKLLDRYSTGRTFTQNIEITHEDIAAAEYVNIFHVDLESEVCL